MKSISILTVLMGTLLLGSCVSMRTYRDTKAQMLRCENSRQAMSDELAQLREQQAALLEQRDGENLNTAELQALLRQRNAAIAEIRRLLSNALAGFDGKGLTVSERGGRIYVSVEDKLLFESGKYEVSSEGARAVRQVAGVLADNPGIQITVEGHTDNLPYRTKRDDQILDNWDLSVKRSTAVVRLLTENKGVDPRRIIASGRSYYYPIATGNTAEARQRNRRTEIILTPDLGRLMEMLDRATEVAGEN